MFFFPPLVDSMCETIKTQESRGDAALHQWHPTKSGSNKNTPRRFHCLHVLYVGDFWEKRLGGILDLNLYPPKFKIAPEKLPSQKESSLPTTIGAMLNFGGVCLW